jgi:hypothetical protein
VTHINEEWRDILGFEGRYKVSSLGRVKSFLEYGKVQERILRQDIYRGNGYFYVTLYRSNGSKEKHYVHRLVAESFLPNPNSLPTVNHKDECKTNNRAENLEWVTYAENLNYGTHNERCADSKRKPILQLSPDGAFIREWGSTDQVAKELGFHQSNINKCLHHKRNFAHGYRWERKF